MLQSGWLENLFLTLPLPLSASRCFCLLLLLKTTSAALKLLNNQHGPAPLTRLMCTHFPGARWLVGSLRAVAPGLGSSGLARLTVGNSSYLPRLGHLGQPHPL